jgi:short-subunit dehydrogenase
VRISGTHVLITGASRGVGYHIARVMVDRGATVTGVARDTERLHKSANEIGFHPGGY